VSARTAAPSPPQQALQLDGARTASPPGQQALRSDGARAAPPSLRAPAADGPAAGRGPSLLSLSLLLFGAALRLWQYGADASQWLDELALSRGILGLSWQALWKGPLPFAQVAPRGFVLLEKAGAEIWGASDYGLRLVPLAGSLAALWLFARLARRVLASPAAVVFAVALFALQPELIRYAAQVKPYAGDLAAALALTLLAAELVGGGMGQAAPAAGDPMPAPAPSLATPVGAGGNHPEHPAAPAGGGEARKAPAGGGRPLARSPVLAGAAGVVAVFLSHAAALVLAGLCVGLLAAAAAGRRRSPARLVVTAVIWAVAAGAAALAASRELPPPTHQYLWHFWAPAFGPRPHTLAGDARWLGSTLAGMLGPGGLGYPWVAVYGGLAILGVAALWRRRPALAPLLFAPVAVALGAADLRLYPFATRLVLFAVPALVLAVAAGVETLAAVRLPRRGVALVFAAALVPALAGFAADPPVYRIEETRPLLRALAARRRPGDAVYVYYGAGHALRFYGPRYGFQAGDYVLGGCHRGDTRAYLEDIDRFRGAPRLWVVFSHAQPRLGERESLLAYLDRLGTRRLALRAIPHGRMFSLPAEAYLYDLSGARQAGRAGPSAATFPISPAPSPIDARLACTGPANPYPDAAFAAIR